jgi:ring-1,2-phenylacetyl-CoA epoxidase subunit PaaE
MAVHFHSLKVNGVDRETPDCVVISFEVPPALAPVFRFDHGQNITLKKTVGNEELRRSYSICSAPHENKLRIAVKRVSSGRLSNYLNNDLRPGDSLDVLPPTGTFNTVLDPGKKKKYLAFAAGSGITPVISIAKAVLATEPRSNFTLVYGNSTLGAIIFFNELAGLKNSYVDRFNLINILSREQMESPLNSGRINAEKLEQLNRILDIPAMDEIFICGPQEMLYAIKNWLEARAVDASKIHFELFTTTGLPPKALGNMASREQFDGEAQINIQLDGRSFRFHMPAGDTSILDAALLHGADLPFACKGGVCATCKAMLEQGEVRMDANYALEAAELKKGFILTCQSHPLTPSVVINFDLR